MLVCVLDSSGELRPLMLVELYDGGHGQGWRAARFRDFRDRWVAMLFHPAQLPACIAPACSKEEKSADKMILPGNHSSHC